MAPRQISTATAPVCAPSVRPVRNFVIGDDTLDVGGYVGDNDGASIC